MSLRHPNGPYEPLGCYEWIHKIRWIGNECDKGTSKRAIGLNLVGLYFFLAKFSALDITIFENG